MILNRLAPKSHREQDTTAASKLQSPKQNLKEGPSGDGRHGLGQTTEAICQPCPQSPSQDDGFHLPLFLQRGRRFHRPAPVAPKVEQFRQHAEDMLQRQVCLLDVHGYIGGNLH